jgi:23S rRNA (pseudouridine1915-N3)-methyltransferase
VRVHILTIGEPKHEYARIGCALYLERLGHYHKVRVTRVRDSKKTGEAGKLEEGRGLLTAAGRAFIVALDPRGKQFTTEALSACLSGLATSGEGEVAFLVGGPDGLSDEVRERARTLWSLSDLTMPHDLAQLVLTEALYRASSFERGEPYHRS